MNKEKKSEPRHWGQLMRTSSQVRQNPSLNLNETFALKFSSITLVLLGVEISPVQLNIT